MPALPLRRRALGGSASETQSMRATPNQPPCMCTYRATVPYFLQQTAVDASVPRMPCHAVLRPSTWPTSLHTLPKQRPHHAHAARCTNHRAGRIHVCNLITARTGKHTCSRCWPITALVNNNIPRPHLFVNYNTPHPPSPVRPIRQSKAIGNEPVLPQCLSPSRQAPQCAIATQCTVPPQAHHRAVSLLFVSFLLACACAHEPTSAAPLFCVASALLCDTRLEHMPFKLQAIARGKGVSQHHQVAKTCYVSSPDL